ncbi:MAG: response regulator [Thermodesulfovibrionales bacterium]|nr:response regulator [Thermodesulfovibrionales bacterium]MDP3111656.1 response regulator [Thermodesulfovibrionales bacterium]
MNKGNILVVDDEDIVLLSCKRALTPEGYNVKTVRRGADGITLLENEAFDIVMTDLKMPDMDGIEVLRRVKEGWPAIEVIIITGYQTVETAVKAIKLGAFDYIEKPFTPEQILTVVNNAVARRANQ